MGFEARLGRLEEHLRDTHHEQSGPEDEISFPFELRRRLSARADGEDVPIDEQEARFLRDIDLSIVARSGLGWELLSYLACSVEPGQPPKSEEVVQTIIEAETASAARRLKLCTEQAPSGWPRVYEEEGYPGSGL